MSSPLLSVLPPVLAVGLALASALSWRQARASAARLRRSVPTQGVVVDVERNPSQQVFPTVRFRTAAGQEVQATAHSSSNTARFTRGQGVGLRYDPADPRWIAVDGLPTMVGVGVTVSVLLGLVAAVLVLVTVLTR